MIDTHVHLSYPSDDSREENLARARDAGTTAFIAVGSTLEDSRHVLDVGEATADMYCGVGVHPRRFESYDNSILEQIREMAQSSDKAVCIGEVGLDYEGPLFGAHLNDDERHREREMFRDFVRLAIELGLPLNMHSDRPSSEDLLQILREEHAYQVGGVMHNFQGSVGLARQYLDLGVYVSASITVHHPLADRLRSVYEEISLGQMVLDSDSPGYMLPRVGEGDEPYPYDMDKVSEPLFARYIAEKVAELKEMSFEEVDAITSLNASRLFRLPTSALG